MPESSLSEPSVSDQELVAATLADSAAYVHLVRRYEAPLMRYLLRLGCKTRSDAEDVLQEVFIKAFRNLNEYDTTLKFSSWLYRITHNEAITFFRKANRLPQVARSDDEVAAFEQIADVSNLADEVDAKLDAAALRAAVDALDPKYRDVLILRFLEDRSYEEISDILRKPPGTVATLISRAKQRLRDLLTTSALP